MKFDELDKRLTALLKALPAGTVADLTEDMVAWWDGKSTVYGSLESAESEIKLSENWAHFRDWLRPWLQHPQFSGALLPGSSNNHSIRKPP